MKVELELKGFTPLFDCIVSEIGLAAAAVYGSVWRYCQMKDKVCKAPVKKIAERAGLKDRATITQLKNLCVSGYIEDCTPDLRNKPHTYKLTDKATLKGEIVAESTMHQMHSGMHQMHSGYAPNAVEDTKEDTKEENTRQILNKLGDAIAEVCGVNINITSHPVTERLKKVTFELNKEGITPADLEGFSSWWWGSSPPTINQFADNWGRYQQTVAATLGKQSKYTAEEIAAYKRFEAQEQKQNGSN